MDEGKKERGYPINVPRAYQAVLAIGKLEIKGNVTPLSWYRHILYDNGKPDVIAITLLAEIVYWYRPIKPEKGTDAETRKKFAADMLQKNRRGFAETFGFTKRQISDGLDRLVGLGLIHHELRTIRTGKGTLCNNVSYIEPIVEELRKITYYADREKHPITCR